jgi:rfaE bifunctional protein nucleotidyltransferase chain/domain
MPALNRIKDKIVSLDNAVSLISQWKEQGEVIVFTNGVFDLIHQGHIAYLADAASFGTKLIIGLNADESVKTLEKGPARPIKDEESRGVILAAMEFVSTVIIFSDSTPYSLIQSLEPDVLIKGGDYNPDETDSTNKRYIVGRDVVLENGGQVFVIPFLEGYSTTSLEKKIIEANK